MSIYAQVYTDGRRIFCVSTEEGKTETIVDVEKVTKAYEVGDTVEALSGVSVSLKKGSYTAAMGPSGSGKSTLLNLIGGLDTPTEGTVRVRNRDLTSLTEDKRAELRGTEVGFVFQTFNLLPRLTAIKNVALPLSFSGVPQKRRMERAEALLEDVGLGDRANHRPPELSGGQRQRVAIARALAPEPSVLLADEPTGNVDTETGERVMDTFERLSESGNTILLVTHERRIAEHADRIIHIRDGEVESREEV